MNPAFILFASSRRMPSKGRGMNIGRRAYQAIALGVSFALLTISSVALGVTPNNANGLMSVSGTVAVNNSRAVSGQTLFSGSTITTEGDSTSVISFHNSGRVRLDANTRLTLGFSDTSLSGSLSEGKMDCIAPAGIRTEITTGDGAIVTDPGQAAQFRAEVSECNTNLSVQTGRVGIRRGGNVRWLAAGESLSSSTPAGPQQQNWSGKKTGLVIAFGAAAAIIIWIIIHNHNNNCTTVVSGTGSSTTCQ